MPPALKVEKMRYHLFSQPISNKPLAVLRMLTGLWFMTDYIVEIAAGWVHEQYIAPPFHFTFIGFEWVSPWPNWGMYLHFVVVALAGFGVLVGYRYRLAILVFLIGHLHVFFIDIVYNLNKSYLFILLAFLLLLMDAHSCWSIDAKRNPKIRRERVPRWNLLVFQLMVAVVYTYSGLSKLTADWLIYHQPMRAFLSGNFLFKYLNNNLLESVISIFTYGGVLFDLSIVALLLNKRTNPFANGAQTLFHLTNLVVLGIGTLSMYMIAVTFLLFPTQWLRKRISYDVIPRSDDRPVKPHTVAFILFFVLAQLLIPHRHYLTGNNVNWTEKGHRFSWRLMTRTKWGSTSSFSIRDEQSGKIWWINPRDYLTNRQYRKMCAETDLVICFAHYLEQLWEEKGYDKVVIRAEVLTRLNMREPQHLISPDLDLTQVERTYLRDEVSTQLVPRGNWR
jgi:vitamin K-dependent gamma-carboxylase